jgi:hypothetical protein
MLFDDDAAHPRKLRDITRRLWNVEGTREARYDAGMEHWELWITGEDGERVWMFVDDEDTARRWVEDGSVSG